MHCRNKGLFYIENCIIGEKVAEWKGESPKQMIRAIEASRKNGQLWKRLQFMSDAQVKFYR